MIEFKEVQQTTFNVRVKGATPLTEIYIINSSFARIHSFMGKANLSLLEGTYTFRFQEGDTIRDKVRFLYKDLTITDPALNNIKGTFLNSNYLNSNFSKSKPLLAFRLKENTNPESIKTSREKVSGLNLLDIKFALKNEDNHNNLKLSLWDFTTNKRHKEDITAEINTDIRFLHPNNTKLIRCFIELSLTNDEVIMLPLIMDHRWEAKIDVTSVLRPDKIIISLQRGENENNELLQHNQSTSLSELSALAHQALESRRAVIADNLLKSMVNNKWTLPWHGIIALHLQTKRPEPKYNLIKIMLQNLTTLYGIEDHPDLVAIQWWLKRQDESYEPEKIKTVKMAPTLSNSWRLLLEAEAYFPGSVISEVFSETIDPRLDSYGVLLFEKVNSLPKNQIEGILQITKGEILVALQSLKIPVNIIFSNGDTNVVKPSIINGLMHMLAHAEKGQLYVSRLLVSLLANSKNSAHLDASSEIVSALLEASEIRLKIMMATGHSLTGLANLIESDVDQKVIDVSSGA